jgi:hypothetical protein
MKGIVAAVDLDEFVSEITKRYKVITPGINQHNSLGFNSDELRTVADACYYGCSFTHGHGVESNQRWTDIIDLDQGYLSNNFGISGACIDDIVAVFIATTKFVDMKRAFFLLPDYTRHTIRVNKDQYINIFPNSSYNDGPAARAWFSLPEHYYADRAQSSINLIEYVAKLNNIEIYCSAWTQEVFDLLPVNQRTNQWYPSDRQGTDRIHPGPNWHRLVAQQFINIL